MYTSYFLYTRIEIIIFCVPAVCKPYSAFSLSIAYGAWPFPSPKMNAKTYLPPRPTLLRAKPITRVGDDIDVQLNRNLFSPRPPSNGSTHGRGWGESNRGCGVRQRQTQLRVICGYGRRIINGSSSVNPLHHNSDQRPISLCNINTFSIRQVMRVKDMITQHESRW